MRKANGKLYDTQESIKEDMFWSIREQLDHPIPALPFTGLVSLEFTFFMPVPKSFPVVKKVNLFGTPHEARPQIVNLIRFYVDVCNGLLYDKDSRIYNINASKIYSEDPRTEIVIKSKERNGTT